MAMLFDLGGTSVPGCDVEFSFGPFVLNTKTAQLTRDDADVRLRPRRENAHECAR